jgi:hypothetical protein
MTAAMAASETRVDAARRLQAVLARTIRPPMIGAVARHLCLVIPHGAGAVVLGGKVMWSALTILNGSWKLFECFLGAI